MWVLKIRKKYVQGNRVGKGFHEDVADSKPNNVPIIPFPLIFMYSSIV